VQAYQEVTREEAFAILLSLTPAEGEALSNRFKAFLGDEEELAATIRRSITDIQRARETSPLSQTAEARANHPGIQDVPDIVQAEDEFELCKLLHESSGLSIALELNEAGRINPIVLVHDGESGTVVELHIESLETLAANYTGEARAKLLAILAAYRAEQPAPAGAA
jgi:hypothetical protein